MTALIYLTGIAVFALIIYLTLELAPAAPTGRLSEILYSCEWRRPDRLAQIPVSPG